MSRAMLLTAVLLAGAPAAAWAQGEKSLESQLADLADDLSKVLLGQGITKVTIQIKGPTTVPSSGPALVTEILGSELKKKNIAVSKLGATHGVSGTLAIEELTDSDGKVAQLALNIHLNIVDSRDKPIADIEDPKIKLRGADVARILGVPFDTGSAGGAGAGAGTGRVTPAIVEGVQNPQQSVDGSIVRARADGKFAIQVLANGQPRNAELEDGKALIDLKQSDKFAVKLINDADFEVAVKLTLDGIDSFWFSREKARLWIVAPHSTQVVSGWQLDDNEAAAFEIVPFKKSVAAEAGLSGDSIGVLQATFSRSYLKGDPLDDFDRDTSKIKNVPIGVGKGEKFPNKVNLVERVIGKARANVPLRYFKPE